MKTEEQHDNHCWLVAGGSWKIRMIDEERLIHLWRGFFPKIEYAFLDISGMDMESYCWEAVHMLEEVFPDFRMERVH